MDYNESNYQNVILKINDTITFNYTGNYNTITLNPGIYKMECWGASGGNGYGGNRIGLGGYTAGTLELKEITKFYIYVGEQGRHYSSYYINNYSFNGGGFADNSSGAAHTGGGGGGASDIRLYGSDWDSLDSLRSRIIAAAGGGGGQPSCGSTNMIGGHGGGLVGTNSLNLGPANVYKDSWGGGGSQTAGGRGENRNQGSSLSEFERGFVNVGSFGKGGGAGICGSGAGGGYYGGGSSYTGGGGGGSSFISGHVGCNAIDKNGMHTNQPNHFSNLIFKDTNMETGINNGNGKVKITILQITNKVLFLSKNKIQYYKDNKFYTLQNKNINNINLNDFIKYGNNLQTEYIGINNRSILSLNDQLDYKMIKNITILYDSFDKKRFNIRKVKKLYINDTGNLKYMIYNGINLYTWTNDEWGIYNLYDNLSIKDIKNMEEFAVKSNVINEINEEYWDQLWNNVDSFKNINFLVFYPESFENTTVKNINIVKDDFFIEKQINNNMIDEINTVDDIQIVWKAGNKNSIKIIYN